MKPKKIEKLVKARTILFELLQEIEYQNDISKTKHLEQAQEVERIYKLYNSALGRSRDVEDENRRLEKESKQLWLIKLENKNLKKEKKDLKSKYEKVIKDYLKNKGVNIYGKKN